MMKRFFCGIVEKNGKLLMIKRGGKLGYGFWAFPGGKAKRNEKPKETVKRELLEETGIKCEPGAQIFEFYHSSEEQVLWYICKFTGGRLKSGSDVLTANWIERDDVFRLNLREGHDQALKAYFDH